MDDLPTRHPWDKSTTIPHLGLILPLNTKTTQHQHQDSTTPTHRNDQSPTMIPLRNIVVICTFVICAKVLWSGNANDSFHSNNTVGISTLTTDIASFRGSTTTSRGLSIRPGQPVKFVYLTQGPEYVKTESEKFCEATRTCDVIFLTFKTPSPRPNDIFMPESNFNTGRNRLLDAALASPTDYDYFIFHDDDVQLEIDPHWIPNGRKPDPECAPKQSPHGCFQHLLAKHKPILGTVRYCERTSLDVEASLPHRFDAIINAFHKSALTYLLPYETIFDDKSMWYSQLMFALDSNMFAHTRRLLFPGILAKNPEHRPYIKAMDYSVPVESIKQTIAPHWYTELCKSVPAAQRLKSKDPVVGIPILQSNAMGGAQIDWPCGLGLSEVKSLLDPTHPHVKRAIEFRQRPDVQKALAGVRMCNVAHGELHSANFGIESVCGDNRAAINNSRLPETVSKPTSAVKK